MQNPKDQLNQLLQPLCEWMQLSGQAYSDYLSNKIYRHAKKIHQANQKICALIDANPSFIPTELQDDIVILRNHYEDWFDQFSEHELKIKPAPDDLFVFYPKKGHIPYPRQAEQKIFQYTENLKKAVAPEA